MIEFKTNKVNKNATEIGNEKTKCKKIYLKDIKYSINLLFINQFFIDAKKMNILRVFKFGFGCGKIKLI